ncbi:MAG: methylated-DNA--[protein]-cysteine S-methyltransferase [Acidobacteria bacterium]|nr:methylated-DNA--[protein]-cysteine S-methyltransferase [Acidobacteriota bacterium]
MYEAGYSSPSRLYGRAARRLGMTPADYLRGGAGLQVSYSIQPSTLGLLLVAATQKGVCAVRFGDSARDLEQGLMAEYPRARIQRDQSLPWTANLLGWLENTSAPLDLPLDIRGTVFQWRVWEYLLRIPLGQTRSYSQAARDLGQPSATRAVAGACAANPVAVLIPCHRMLRADGALGGYRWGLERKQALLEKEQRTIASH